MDQKRSTVFLERYMSLVGPIGNLMFYFQAYEIFTTEASGAVSLPGFAISVIALTSWLLYGIVIRNTPLIIANAFGAVGAITVVMAIWRYSG